MNGKSTQIVPCKIDKDRLDNTIDTCYSEKYQKTYQVTYYKNDELNGPSEMRDSADVLRFKGNFINGEKDGIWLESYTGNELWNYENYYMYKKGNYSLGKRTGQWIEYYDESKIENNFNYTNGELDGKSITYNSKGKESIIYQLNYGKLKTVDVFDSLGIDVIRSYEIINETNSGLKCVKTVYFTDGKYSQEYWITKDYEDPIKPKFFEVFFNIKTGKKSDGFSGYRDGEYKLFDASNKVILEGAYYQNTKLRKWKTYFYDVNIYKEQEYSNDIGGIEKYFLINSGKLFSGKFIQKYENKKSLCEFKISDGLRDGKSKSFDENGKITKSEIYKKGILDN